MSSGRGSDGRAAAALRQLPRAAEIRHWPRRARAEAEVLRCATQVLMTAVHACAVDDRVPSSDDYALYDQVLAVAHRCGRVQWLEDPLPQIHVGKVCLAAWVAAEWAQVLCQANDRFLSGALGRVIGEVWRAERALDLELRGAPDGVEAACGQLARIIRDQGNVPDPAVAAVITLMSRVYVDRSRSTTAAHGILAEALMDAGRGRDLVHDGVRGDDPGPEATYLGDALMGALHPPIVSETPG